MRLIASHNGKLLTLNPTESADAGRSFSSGFAQWDAIAPGGAFARGAIHELLTAPADGKAMLAAMVLGMSAITFGSLSPSPGTPGEGRVRDHANSPHPNPPPEYRERGQVIIWIDPARQLYPPALAAHGFPLDRLILLHPKAPDPKGTNLVWAIAECLRCKGVGAVVAAVPRVSRIQARRLQLAAEQGGGVGLLLRHAGRSSACHAAASRWLIRPAPGGRNRQCWTIQLLHGHGGHIGHTLCLEHCRETNHLHTFNPMVDRPAQEKERRTG